MKSEEFLDKMFQHMQDTAPEWFIQGQMIRRQVTNRPEITACAISSLEDEPAGSFCVVAEHNKLENQLVGDIVAAADNDLEFLRRHEFNRAVPIRQKMLEAIGKEENK